MKREALAVYPVLDLGHTTCDAALIVAALLRGGATMLQLRDKRDGCTQMLDISRAIKAKLHAAAVPLMINDRLDLALALGADGVHVGQTDISVATVRQRAHAAGCVPFLVGVSVITVAQAQAALAAGADYVSISPIFATASKPDIDPPVGLEGLRAVRRALPQAGVVAIGGIRAPRAAEVIKAGADGVAFISAFADDVARAESAVRAMAAAVCAAKE